MFNLIALRIERTQARATLKSHRRLRNRWESSGSGDRRFESFLASHSYRILWLPTAYAAAEDLPQTGGSVTLSLTMPPSRSRARISPFGPNSGGTTKDISLPDHEPISLCVWSNT